MAIHKDNILWWKVIRRKFHRSSSHHQNSNSTSSIIVLHNNDGPFSSEGFNSGANSDNGVSEFMESREGVAAISIQACFRRHLALRAYKALKSLVKLQALVRGVLIRRQARIALSCMNALARLQITVRSRQLLNARHY